MENDPAHAKRFEDNLTRRTEFANPEREVAGSSEGGQRARQDEIGPPQDASSSSAGADVDMRPLEPGGDDDMVCGFDVCDELNEYSSDAYVNDCEGDHTDEVTGVRDGVAKARAEEMAGFEKFKAHEVCQERDANPWKYEADSSNAKSNRKGQTATSKEHHRLHSYVTL